LDLAWQAEWVPAVGIAGVNKKSRDKLGLDRGRGLVRAEARSQSAPWFRKKAWAALCKSSRDVKKILE
jgi:hypothetical protein